MTHSLPAAVLWDMDGTIVDTEPYWMLAEEEMFAEFEISWSHADSLEVVGAALGDAAKVFQRHGIPLEADVIIERLSNRVIEQLRASVPWRPGARELLLELLEAGIPTALVTMSYNRMATMVADALGFAAFKLVVSGDMVENGKPHPEPYLRAAAELGVPITECVAIEDSGTGVASAIASGAATIGIPLHVALPGDADFTEWDSLAGRSVTDLAEVLAVKQAATLGQSR